MYNNTFKKNSYLLFDFISINRVCYVFFEKEIITKKLNNHII